MVRVTMLYLYFCLVICVCDILYCIIVKSCFFSFVVFMPIFASAKMCINPNAEVDLKTPKANVHLEVQNIAFEITRPQVCISFSAPIKLISKLRFIINIWANYSTVHVSLYCMKVYLVMKVL